MWTTNLLDGSVILVGYGLKLVLDNNYTSQLTFDKDEGYTLNQDQGYDNQYLVE